MLLSCGRPERRTTARSLESISKLDDIFEYIEYSVSDIVRFIYDDDRRLSFLKYETVNLVLEDYEVIGLAECKLGSSFSGKIPVKIIYSQVEELE